MYGLRAQNRDPRVTESGRDSGTTVIAALHPFLLLRRLLALPENDLFRPLRVSTNRTPLPTSSQVPFHMAPCSKLSSRNTLATLSDVGMEPTFTARIPCPGMVFATTHQHMDLTEYTASLTADYGRSRFIVSTHYLALDVPGRLSSNSPFRTISTRRSLKINGALKHETSL